MSAPDAHTPQAHRVVAGRATTLHDITSHHHVATLRRVQESCKRNRSASDCESDLVDTGLGGDYGGDHLDAGELRVDLLLSRMEKAVGVDSEDSSVAEVILRLDGAVVAVRRLFDSTSQRNESANRTCSMKLAVYGGDSHLTLAVDLYMLANLETGMHILEASLLLRSDSVAAAHTVSFWWVKLETPRHWSSGGGNGIETRETEGASLRLTPTVTVVRHSLREIGVSEAHEMVVWLVLQNFQVGMHGSLVLVDNDAIEHMVYPKILEWGTTEEAAHGHLRRLWPIASVSCGGAECTVARVLAGRTVMPCAEGSKVSWPGASVRNDLTLYEMVVQIPPDPDASCHAKHFTIYLQSLSGMPIEETSALCQWVVDLHCGPHQVPRRSLPEEEQISMHTLMNRNWPEVTWWHHRAKFSRQNAGGNPTCYWYAGPLAGALFLSRESD